MVISFVLNKGGTGKTTTAVNVAAALARFHGMKVLLADLDGQASASWALGMIDTNHSTTADAFLYARPLREIARPTSVDGLWLAPASHRLGSVESALHGHLGRDHRLAAALAGATSEFDVILLDCPPSLSLILENALACSDLHIVPVAPEYLALRGLVGLDRALEDLRQSRSLHSELLGILLTRVDYRVRITSDVVNRIRELYGEDVFQTEIRVNVRLSEAPAHGKDIFAYAPSSPGAEAYRTMAVELVNRIGRSKPRAYPRLDAPPFPALAAHISYR